MRNGVVLTGGFFIGPRDFYDTLRGMTDAQRRRFEMTGVEVANQLYGDERLRALQRRDARFCNTGMKATLLGHVVSDGLEDGSIVSGVGGQYNFVAMAHALPDARLVMMVKSTRHEGGKTLSNIVFHYGHVTIPRHLRDVVVTDHGIADLRARTDGEVIEALLAVSDSRFQAELAERAHASHKLTAPHVVPEQHRDNRPEAYRAVLDAYRAQGFFPAYPFGSDLTEQERVLARALKGLKDKIESTGGKLELLADLVTEGAIGDDVRPYLERMGLAAPSSIKETLYQRLLAAELRELGAC
jgi:acyl-CoA hydrolase